MWYTVTPLYSFILEVSTLSNFKFKYIPHVLDVLLLYVCGASGTTSTAISQTQASNTSFSSIIDPSCSSNSACPFSRFHLQELFETHTSEVTKIY